MAHKWHKEIKNKRDTPEVSGAPTNCTCDECAGNIERDALVEMYGEENGNYFATVGIFPGDN